MVRETISLENQTEEKQSKKADQDEILIKNVGAFEEQPKAKSVDPEPKKIVEEKETAKEPAKSADGGPTVVGKIDLSTIKSNQSIAPPSTEI